MAVGAAFIAPHAHHDTAASQCSRAVTVQSARPFIEKVWSASLDRGSPPALVRKAWRKKLHCAGPENRAAMKHRWRQEKHAYFHRRSRKLAEERWLAAITPPGPAVLATIRSCESGGDYSINTGNGFYGAYQFDIGTWASVGGSGLPSEASPREQDERAAALYQSRGSSPWPVCGV